MRVEEAFAAAGINREGKPIADSWIRARCPECGSVARLDTLETTESGQQTTYNCLNCDKPVVIVGPAPGLTGGYRLKDNVVLPLGGMEIVVPPPPR